MYLTLICREVGTKKADSVGGFFFNILKMQCVEFVSRRRCKPRAYEKTLSVGVVEKTKCLEWEILPPRLKIVDTKKRY